MFDITLSVFGIPAENRQMLVLEKIIISQPNTYRSIEIFRRNFNEKMDKEKKMLFDKTSQAD